MKIKGGTSHRHAAVGGIEVPRSAHYHIRAFHRLRRQVSYLASNRTETEATLKRNQVRCQMAGAYHDAVDHNILFAIARNMPFSIAGCESMDIKTETLKDSLMRH